MRSSIAFHTCLFIAIVCFSGSYAHGDDTAPLDNAKLKTMLENMGYDFSEQKYASGLPYFQATVRYQEVNYKVDLSIKRDGSILWITIDLKYAPKGVTIPSNILIGMLHDNYVNAETIYFAYNKADGHFRLKGSLPTANLRPIEVRRAVDKAVHKCNRTYKLWNPAEWPAPGDAGSKPDAEKGDK